MKIQINQGKAFLGEPHRVPKYSYISNLLIEIVLYKLNKIISMIKYSATPLGNLMLLFLFSHTACVILFLSSLFNLNANILKERLTNYD